jgi:hypothetical protein
MKKIKFKRDFAPFKKDDIIETDERQSTWYVSNGIAELACGCEDGKEDCEDCKGKKAKTIEPAAEEVVVAKPKKSTTKK